MNKLFGMNESERTKSTILSWYYKGQLSYFDLYINLFISYNAWFKQVTKETTDRAAVNALKERFIIWDEYRASQSLRGLNSVVSEISILTKDQPLQNLTGDNRHWDGVVADEYDWKSLIEYWYRVRCNLFHGSKSPEDAREQRVVELAYKSLNIFMTEIIGRIETNLSKGDLGYMTTLREIAKLQVEKLETLELGSPEYEVALTDYENTTGELGQFKGIQAQAYDLWNVDMERSNGREVFLW